MAGFVLKLELSSPILAAHLASLSKWTEYNRLTVA